MKLLWRLSVCGFCGFLDQKCIVLVLGLSPAPRYFLSFNLLNSNSWGHRQNIWFHRLCSLVCCLNIDMCGIDRNFRISAKSSQNYFYNRQTQLKRQTIKDCTKRCKRKVSSHLPACTRTSNVSAERFQNCKFDHAPTKIYHTKLNTQLPLLPCFQKFHHDKTAPAAHFHLPVCFKSSFPS